MAHKSADVNININKASRCVGLFTLNSLLSNKPFKNLLFGKNVAKSVAIMNFLENKGMCINNMYTLVCACIR